MTGNLIVHDHQALGRPVARPNEVDAFLVLGSRDDQLRLVGEESLDANSYHDRIVVVWTMECRGVVWHETKIPFQGFPVRFIVGLQQQGIDALPVDG